VQGIVTQSFIDQPANLNVTVASSNAITLTWGAVMGVDHYQVERSDTMSGPFTTVGNNVAGNTTTFTDTSVSNLHAYVYRARAIGFSFQTGEMLISQPSNMAFGTAITFLPSPLAGQQIAAQHIYDMRTAINLVRTLAFLPSANWTRSTLNGLQVRASDVQELRDRLEETLAVLQVPPFTYQDPVLFTGANGTQIKAAHLEQLRQRSSRVSSSIAGPIYPNASKAQVGEFGPTKNLPLVPVHLSVLPNRKILFWGRDLQMNPDGTIPVTSRGDAKQVVGRSDVYIWDGTNTPQHVDNLMTNLFCSGHTFLPDGRLFVAGGHNDPDTDGVGDKETNIFDFRNESWTAGPVMDHGRWYPFNVTLPTGEVVILSGGSDASQQGLNLATDVYKLKIDTNPLTPQGDLRQLDNADSTITTYPYLHLMPNGKILQGQSGVFAVCFNGSLDCIKSRKGGRTLDPLAPAGTQWTDIPDGVTVPHAQGSSVLYDSGRKALLTGGFQDGLRPSKEAESISLTASTLMWNPEAPMNFKRTYHTSTILPNGKVLVTGGVSCPGGDHIESFNQDGLACSDGEVMNAELWDPQTGQWTILAPQKEIRAYHSVAALLPDGTVLVGGGGRPGAVGEIDFNGNKITDANQRKPGGMSFGHANVEIYSPPYLFNANGTPATRPVITTQPPETTANGETFFIGTSGAGSQPKVSLVRFPSVTHAFNQDQRQISLTPMLASGGMFVTVPSSPNECPPGYYMLFVLNSSDVPSIAAIIQVRNPSLFPFVLPVTTATGQGLTWEQGIEFSSLVNGQITHIRFYKALGEPSGGHVGHIWDATTGMELASAQFFNETASGWQEAQLSTPLPITANTRYKVTYNVHNLVAKTFDVFPPPVFRWPLVGWGSSFSTPAGSFPTTGSTSNLFADVRFK
jgi:hypothetical protein